MTDKNKNFDPKNCGIYMWLCTPTNKCYIGQSSELRRRKNLFLRFDVWKYAGEFINKARRKYNSPEFWEYKILEYCAPDELNAKEEMYIYLYNSNNQDLGYNLTIGGETTRGYQPSEKTKKNISKGLKKKYESGWKGSFYGMHHSDETKKKISQKRIGKYKGIPVSEKRHKKMIENAEKFKIEILQIDIETREIIKEWKSATDIRNELGYDNSQIGKACKRINKTAYGYLWRYKDDFSIDEIKNYSIEPIKPDPICYKKSADKKKKPVVQLDKEGKFIKEWESSKEASEYLNVNRTQINGCCCGRFVSCGGYIWVYKKDYDPNKIEKRNFQKKPIIQYDMDMNFIREWDSARTAEKELNFTKGSICEHCRKELTKNYKGYKGFIWRYKYTENENETT